MSEAEFRKMDVRLARIEERQALLLDGFRSFAADCKSADLRTDKRLDALERDSVRTKTIFGMAAGIWPVIIHGFTFFLRGGGR